MPNGREMSGTWQREMQFIAFSVLRRSEAESEHSEDFRSIEWFEPPAAARTRNGVISRPFAPTARR
jgi:hypothetical protein